MERINFEEPEENLEQAIPSKDLERLESREAELPPLATAEAGMLVEKFGDGIIREGEEGRGFLTRLPEKVKKFGRMMLLGTALSGGLGIELADADDRRTYGISAQDIHDEAYKKERERLARQQEQREVRDIQNTARDHARADAEWQRDPRQVVDEARAKERARVEAQYAKQRSRNLERFGKDLARQDAILARDPLARVIVGLFNLPNKIVTGAIDSIDRR